MANFIFVITLSIAYFLYPLSVRMFLAQVINLAVNVIAQTVVRGKETELKSKEEGERESEKHNPQTVHFLRLPECYRDVRVFAGRHGFMPSLL